MDELKEMALEYCSTRPTANVWAWEFNHFDQCEECQTRVKFARAYADQELASERVGDVKALLGRTTPQARQMLRKLVVDKFTVEPVREGERRGFRFSGKITLGRVLSGAALDAGSRMLVAPTGFEPVFQP